MCCFVLVLKLHIFFSTMTSYADKGEQVCFDGLLRRPSALHHTTAISNPSTCAVIVRSPTMASSLALTTSTGGSATPRWLVSQLYCLLLRRFGFCLICPNTPLSSNAASWYAVRMGFEIVAYSGLETGNRDCATWVVQQGDVSEVH